MKKMFSKKASILLLSSLGSMSLAGQAFAYDASDWTLRFGTATVDPVSESDDLDQLAGAQVSADTDTQLGFSGTYMFTSNWGIEILAATPFSHDTEGKGTVIDGQDIGSVKHLPPTVSAQYFFLDAQSQWQPYVGLGLNYTTFFSEEAGDGAKAIGYDKLELDDCFGLAASFGVDYNFTENWGINASIM